MTSAERVSIIEGKYPFLVVAPHGVQDDDYNTAAIAESMAVALKGYAVINRGWERAADVDCLKDKADCNKVDHMVDVVKDEFLDPILRFKTRMVRKWGSAYVFMIHGMGNDIRKRTGDKDIDMIIGYGAGSPPSYSCELWQKDLFIYLLHKSKINAWAGKAGGPMSGWARSNMNQLFRKHYHDDRVCSMQVEIIRDLRDDDLYHLTAEELASAAQDLQLHQSFSRPSSFHIKEY